MKLITHSGNFHADDVLAYAILKSISQFSDAELIRTRDEEVFAAATSEDVVFDVGFVFDPDRNRFDHHMNDKPLREDATPYSSVGLIWRKFGLKYLQERYEISPELIEDVWARVDRGLIHDIDLTDNGLGEGFRPSSFAILIDEFNRAWDDVDFDEDLAFKKAADFAADILQRKIVKAISLERGYWLALEAIKSSENPQLIVLPRSMPWAGPLHDNGFDKALYVVYEKPDGWYLEGVRTSADSFELRKPLPSEWGGKRGADLAAASGIDDAIFCHSGLFLCGAKSKESIMKMAQMALAYEPAAPRL